LYTVSRSCFRGVGQKHVSDHWIVFGSVILDDYVEYEGEFFMDFLAKQK